MNWEAVRYGLARWVPISTIRVMVQDALVGVAFLIIIWMVSPLVDRAVPNQHIREQFHILENWAAAASWAMILASGLIRLGIRVVKEIVREYKDRDGIVGVLA